MPHKALPLVTSVPVNSKVSVDHRMTPSSIGPQKRGTRVATEVFPRECQRSTRGLGVGRSNARPDRASLRLSPATLPAWRTELDRLATVHRWVVGGLALILASGVLMALAELGSLVTSVVFWTKMGLVALLIGNGYARLRAEMALRQGSVAAWGWFRWTSIGSLILWFLILLAGTLLHSTI